MEVQTKVKIIHEGSETYNHGKLEFLLDQEKFYKISGYVKDLKDMFQQKEDRDIEITVKDTECTKYGLEKIVEWCERTGYSNKRTQTPLSSGRLQDNLDPQSYEFIKGIDYNKGNQLKDIYEGARYFQIDPLVEVCVIRIATEFYFGNDQQSFEDLKKKLSIQEDLTIEKEEQLKQQYAWLDKKDY